VALQRKKSGKRRREARTNAPARRLYIPRAHQRDLHDRLKRFSVLVAHRRFGKGALYH